MEKISSQPDAVRRLVRERYGKIVEMAGSCCGAGRQTSCCAPSSSRQGTTAGEIGYSSAEIAIAPEAAEMGLGCGNPQAIANLKPGETVLDLGSGAGFDGILAAQAVGPGGTVIGVDMTDAMLRKAQRNARKAGLDNLEFRKGEIEALPVESETIDVIISNCVVNLSPEKSTVMREAYRVLKPGGRLAISDVVAVRPLPESIRRDPDMQCACVGGAITVDELHQMLAQVGFQRIRITTREESRRLIEGWAPGQGAGNFVISATIEAVRPH